MEVMIVTAARALLLFIALPALLICQRPTRYYRTMQVDPVNLTVRFSNGYPDRPGFPPQGPYFDRFDRADATMVEQMVPLGLDRSVSRLGTFWLSPDLVLLQRGKIQELFRGSLGVVFARSQYDYEARYGIPAIGFDVRPYDKTMQHEPARVINELPSSVLHLNTITVIRAFHTAPEELVAVGTYSSAGELLNTTVEALRQGSLTASSVGADINSDIRTFGFPLNFSVFAYQRSPTSLNSPVDRPSVLTVVSFHYDRNRWVKQYVFEDPEGAHSKYDIRFLEFQYTDQDAALEATDRSLPWQTLDRRRDISK